MKKRIPDFERQRAMVLLARLATTERNVADFEQRHPEVAAMYAAREDAQEALLMSGLPELLLKDESGSPFDVRLCATSGKPIFKGEPTMVTDLGVHLEVEHVKQLSKAHAEPELAATP